MPTLSLRRAGSSQISGSQKYLSRTKPVERGRSDNPGGVGKVGDIQYIATQSDAARARTICLRARILYQTAQMQRFCVDQGRGS